MPLPRAVAVASLLMLGAAFAAANLWFCAARSTIPLQLDGQATRKVRLTEKTHGVDDVYLLTLDDSAPIQVDALVYEAVVPNRLVRKEAWSREIEFDGTMVDLDWSSDFKGMLWAMPSVMLVLVVVGILAIGKRFSGDDERQQGDAELSEEA